MAVFQEEISPCVISDSSSKPSIKLSTAYHPYTRSGYTGLLTPPLPSPSPRSYAHSKHGSTPPREADDSQGVRLPPISELLKLVPSPAIQLPAPRRLSSWSPDYTSRPSPTCLSSPQSFYSAHSSENSRAQCLPLPPIIQDQSQYPSPPTSHWTHLPPRTTAHVSPPRKRRRDDDQEDRRPSPPLKRRRNAYREDHPNAPLKRRRDAHQEDHGPSPPLKRRRHDYWEDVRRNSTPNHWVQPGAPPVLASSPDTQEQDFWTQYSRRQSAHNLCAQADMSQALVPYSDRSIAPPAKKKKKENTPYTQEQEFFIRYFVVDLGYSWEVVQEHYMSWFPTVHRTVGALTCEYYRTNKQIPVIEDGLLVLGQPRHPEEQLSKHEYRGFKFVCKEQQCRKDKIHSLLAVFPEEYDNPDNRWILPEHRGKGGEAAQRRQEQRARESRRYKAKL